MPRSLEPQNRCGSRLRNASGKPTSSDACPSGSGFSVKTGTGCWFASRRLSAITTTSPARSENCRRRQGRPQRRPQGRLQRGRFRPLRRPRRSQARRQRWQRQLRAPAPSPRICRYPRGNSASISGAPRRLLLCGPPGIAFAATTPVFWASFSRLWQSARSAAGRSSCASWPDLSPMPLPRRDCAPHWRLPACPVSRRFTKASASLRVDGVEARLFIGIDHGIVRT